MIGSLSIGWISRYFRKATIEIDCSNPSLEPPLKAKINKEGKTIKLESVFDEVGWEIKVDDSSLNKNINKKVKEAIKTSFSINELHQQLSENRDPSTNLDQEWRYHIFFVNKLDFTERGAMFDAKASDSDDVPREGAAIALNGLIPNEKHWGNVKNHQFSEHPELIFRTVVHEIGHAMGLEHRNEDNCFMNTTDSIARATTAVRPFPENIGTGSLRGDTELKALLYKVFTGLASKTRKYRLCKGLRCFITR